MWGKTIEDDKIKCNTILGSNDKTKVRRLDEVGAEGRERYQRRAKEEEEEEKDAGETREGGRGRGEVAVGGDGGRRRN